MKSKMSTGKLFSALLFSLLIVGGSGHARSGEEFVPEIGQEGKDVQWVPTSQALVEKMLDMAKVTPGDYVVDLGSGDGRIVIAAAKRGARAHGIEYDRAMVELSKRNAARQGVSEKATFAKMDIFESDFSHATVVTMFLLPELNLQLRPTILDMKPGTRIVSNTFDMEDWIPDETAMVDEDCPEYQTEYRTAHFWVVPAKVGGAWKLEHGELILKQKFQMITGVIKSGNESVLLNGRLNGNAIRFRADGVEYTGIVRGNSIKGHFQGKRSGEWIAARK